MASKKLSYDQIAEKDLLNPLISELSELNKVLEKTSENLKDVAKEAQNVAKNTPFDNFENIRKVEKAINDTKKATSELDRIEKQRIKLQEKINDLNDERIKDNFDLQEQIKQQTKELRNQAKEANTIRSAYEQLTKDTNEAQKRFKDLAAEFGANSKEAKKAKREFNRLNDELENVNKEAKDGRRLVGRYRDEMKKAAGDVGKAAGVFGLILAALQKLSEIFQSNTEAAGGFQKVFDSITITLQVFVNRLVKAAPLILDLFTNLFDDIKNSASGFSKSLQIRFLESINVMGAFDDKINDLRMSFNDTEESFEKSGNTLNGIRKIFEGTTDDIVKLVTANNKLIDLTIQYRKEIIGLEKENAKLLDTQAEAEARANDQTKSLQEQIKGFEDLLKVNQEINDNNILIAQKEFELATQRAAINKANLDLQEAAKDAFVAFEQAKIEAQVQTNESLREISQLEQDLLEQRLDILFDDADTRKTINEQIINDENATFAQRRKALQENRFLAEETFKAQTKLVNDNLKEQGKAIIDFTELSRIESEKEITERLVNAGLSEILTTRALELLRERRLFLQDNAVSVRDLTDAERESNDVRKDIIAQEDALAMLRKGDIDSKQVLEKLEETRLQNEISNLRQRIALEKSAIQTQINQRIAAGESIEDLVEKENANILNLQKELNDKLLEEQEKANEKGKEKELKKQEDIQKATEKGFEVLDQLRQKNADKRLADIDADIEAQQTRVDELRDLAAQGNNDAEKNLAQAEKRQAELAREREKEVKRQQLAELGLVALQTYTAKVQAGDENPLFSTITDIQLLRGFIDSLPAFYGGSERISDDLNATISGKDGYVVRVDGGERVMPSNLNSMIPNDMSNRELAMIANRANTYENTTKHNEQTLLLNEMREVKRAIEGQETYKGMDYNAKEKSITDTIQRKNRLERIHRSKKRGLFG